MVGMLTKLAQTVTYDAYDWTLGQGFRTFRMLSSDEMKAKFDELDTDNNCVLSKKEVARALRELGHTEAQIDRMCGYVEESGLNFEEFKALVVLPEYFGGTPEPEKEEE